MSRSTVNTTAPRLFVAAPLHARADIALTTEQAHYLGTVLRRDSGATVRLFNGVDGEWSARLVLSRRSASAIVEEPLRPQTPEAGHWLVFAVLKRDATDLVVRQAVELGASRLLPVVTERTNTARINEDRLRSIATEAAEQSERLTVPPIDALTRLDSVLANWPAGRRLFVALERGTASPPPRGPGAAALLVGPEGGFTPAERDMPRRWAFMTEVSLGPYVLRAETAAAAGQALLPGMGWAEYGGAT